LTVGPVNTVGGGLGASFHIIDLLIDTALHEALKQNPVLMVRLS
jgi:hypothetical protein